MTQQEEIIGPAYPMTIAGMPTLDSDIDTSLVTSLPMHLISEHQIYGALRMSEREAVACHQQLHLKSPQNHPVVDLRFRPGAAKSALMLNFQRQTEVRGPLISAGVRSLSR